MEPKPFALLKLVWIGANRTIAADNAIAEVWGGAEGDTSVKNAQVRINKALFEVNCPHSISRKGNSISLS